MAASGKQQRGRNQNVGKTFSFKRLCDSYANYGYLKSILVNPSKLIPIACLIFLAEIVINLAVVNCVKYTEIDWKAYMQEVETVLNGTLDYSLVRGDTGPLVYPAGFVWIFSCSLPNVSPTMFAAGTSVLRFHHCHILALRNATENCFFSKMPAVDTAGKTRSGRESPKGLYFLTGRGENILFAQYIYASLYLLNLILVLRIYVKSKKIPPYVLILTCLTSYRIHSIFALRLFNDPIAILLLYASLNAFLDSKWSLGSFLYSLAVSVKMNILLFSPALLLAYLTCLGLKRTLQKLIICAGLQVVLALPFLLTHPLNYLIGAFDFGRVFLYEWTVNWRFLPEEIFLDKKFHVFLLVLHLSFLAIFYKTSALHLKCYAKLKSIEEDIKPQLKTNSDFNMNASNRLFLLPMFLSNFIGIVFSRSLHYQFYVWYFHTLPFLLWSTNYSTPTRLFLLGVIELCWNTFPSTSLSSLSLQACHLTILYGLYRAQAKLIEGLNEKKL